MSDSLRIAMFVGCFPVLSETFILRQITGLLDLGHEVDIFADLRGDPSGPVQEEVRRYGLLGRTVFMDMPSETAPYEMSVWPVWGRTWPPGANRPVWNLRRLARAAPRFLRCVARAPRFTAEVLKCAGYGYRAGSLSGLYRLAHLLNVRRSYDVAHAHFGPTANSFRFVRRLWQVPLVVSFHGYDFCTVPRREGGRVYERLFADVDLVTVNSDYTRRCLERLSCPSALLHKLPVGLDPTAFSFRERSVSAHETLRLLTVARLVEIKGHEYVLRALAQLVQRGGNVHYDIAGEGPERGRIEALISDLALHAHVTLHGAVTGEKIRHLLDAAHVGILASVSVEGDQEGQGLFLQEAQASGLPVIATDHGGLPEGLVPGRSGFLVPERNADALAERIDFLVRHPELLAEMGRAGRHFATAAYDRTGLNQQLVAFYREAMQKYGRDRG